MVYDLNTYARGGLGLEVTLAGLAHRMTLLVEGL